MVLFLTLSCQYVMPYEINETSRTKQPQSMEALIEAFIFKTHREFVTVPREFFLLEYTVMSCICGKLFNTNATHLKLSLRQRCLVDGVKF